MFLFSTLFFLILLQGYAPAPDVSVDCPGSFIDNVVRNVTGSLNSSVLTVGPTENCIVNVSAVNFFLIKGSNTPTLLCTQNFSASNKVCDQNFNAKGCRCDRNVGNMFYYTYQFTANKQVQEGGVIQMKPNCVSPSGTYPLVETLCNITFETITTATLTTDGNTSLTTLQPSYVSSSSVTIITITSGTTDHSTTGATDYLTPGTTLPISDTFDYAAIIVGTSYAGLVIVTSGIVIVFLKLKKKR